MASNNPYALIVNTSSSYVSVPTVPLGNEWTLEGFVKFPIPGGGCQTLTRGLSDHQIIFYPNLGVFDNATNTGMHECGYSNSKISNGWHRITTVGKNSSQRFYVDGVYVGTSNFQSKSNIVAIGNYQGGGQSIGTFDDVRLFNYARSDAEVLRDWNRKISNNTTGLVSYWEMNEGTGNIVKNSVNSSYNGTFSGSLSWTTDTFNLVWNKYLIQDGNRIKITNDAINLTDLGDLPFTLNEFQNYGMSDFNKINNTVINKIVDNKYKIAIYKPKK